MWKAGDVVEVRLSHRLAAPPLPLTPRPGGARRGGAARLLVSGRRAPCVAGASRHACPLPPRLSGPRLTSPRVHGHQTHVSVAIRELTEGENNPEPEVCGVPVAEAASRIRPPLGSWLVAQPAHVRVRARRARVKISARGARNRVLAPPSRPHRPTFRAVRQSVRVRGGRRLRGATERRVVAGLRDGACDAAPLTCSPSAPLLVSPR